MVNGRRMPPEEMEVQLPDSKSATANLDSGTLSGPLVAARSRWSFVSCLTIDAVHVVLRLSCVITSVTALSFMVTAREDAAISFYGFKFPLKSKWSLSDSFEYLVGVSAAVAAHSLLQLLIGLSRMVRRCPIIHSRNYAWLIYAGDQLFAYAMLSAGSAAIGVTNLNRTGIRHTALPNLCKPLHAFCDHVAFSVVFTFFSCFLLAASAVQDIIWLSKY